MQGVPITCGVGMDRERERRVAYTKDVPLVPSHPKQVELIIDQASLSFVGTQLVPVFKLASKYVLTRASSSGRKIGRRAAGRCSGLFGGRGSFRFGVVAEGLDRRGRGGSDSGGRLLVSAHFQVEIRDGDRAVRGWRR